MPSVVELVRERFGELTQIQKLAMPKVLEGQHVLILAPTGSGKTESALLPILEKIKQIEAAESAALGGALRRKASTRYTSRRFAPFRAI